MTIATMPSAFSRFGPLAALLALASATAGCASHPPAVPPNVTVGATIPADWPAPPETPSGANAQILAAHFSSLDVKRGQTWSGTFVTGTNAASLEVRTNLFSIDVPRTAFGRFSFDADVFDTPPIFVRPYTLRIIARNTAGQETEEDLPFEIR
jgi:hypothetical protein